MEPQVPIPTPPQKPQAFTDAGKQAIQSLVKETIKGDFDERIEDNYKGLTERMDADFGLKMAQYEQVHDLHGRQRELTGGKHLLGALIHAKGQRTPGGNQFVNAATVAKSLDSFMGSRRSWEKALNLEDAESGGTLVQGEVVDFFFSTLRANSVVFSLNPVRRMLINDQGTLTGFETDPQITWVGEVNTDQEIVSEGTTGNRAFSAKKAMLATPVSNDLLKTTLGGRIAQEIEEQIRFAYQIGFDIVLISGAGTLFRPKGIRNWALPANEVDSSGQALANIFDDYRDAFNAIESLNVPMRNMGQIMAPRSKNHIWLGNHGTDSDRWALRQEMVSGSLFGVPWRVTTNVPTNLGGGTNESFIIFADFSQIVVMEGPGVEIARSNEASWTENAVNQNPREQDVTVFWSLAKLETVVPHPEAIYIITAVLYGT